MLEPVHSARCTSVLRPSGVTPERLIDVAKVLRANNPDKHPTMRVLRDQLVCSYNLSPAPSLDTIWNVVQEVNAQGSFRITLKGKVIYEESDILTCIEHLRNKNQTLPNAKEVFREYRRRFPDKQATANGINAFIRKMQKSTGKDSDTWQLSDYNESTSPQAANNAFQVLKQSSSAFIFIPTLAELREITGGSQQALRKAILINNCNRAKNNLNPIIHMSPTGQEYRIVRILEEFLKQDSLTLGDFIEKSEFYKNHADGVGALKRYFSKLLKYKFPLLGEIKADTTSSSLKKYSNPEHLTLIKMFCYLQSVTSVPELKRINELAQKTSNFIVTSAGWEPDRILGYNAHLKSRVLILAMLCACQRVDADCFANLLLSFNKFDKLGLVKEVDSIIQACFAEELPQTLLLHRLGENNALLKKEQINDYLFRLQEVIPKIEDLQLAKPNLFIFQYGNHQKKNFATQISKVIMERISSLTSEHLVQMDLKDDIETAHLIRLTNSQYDNKQRRSFHEPRLISEALIQGFSTLISKHRTIDKAPLILTYLAPKYRREKQLLNQILEFGLNHKFTSRHSKRESSTIETLQKQINQHLDKQAQGHVLVDALSVQTVTGAFLEFYVFKRT